MKTNRKAGKEFRNTACKGAILAGACLLGSLPLMADEAKKSAPPAEAAAEPDVSDLVNWIQVGIGGSIVHGDKAQYQQQKGMRTGLNGGIESFHYETPVAKKGLFMVEGRGIFDNHDYSIKMELSHPDKGYLKLGYTTFREYYDGSGGYYGPENLSFNGVNGLFDNRLGTDRSHVSFEAGLTLPDKPVIVVRYDYEVRDGTKDTTSWGEALLADGVNVKKIVPSFRTLDETRHQFAVDLTHGIGKTDFGLGGRYERQHNEDLRTVVQRPGKTSTRLLTDDNSVNSDMFNVHAFTDTTLSDKWRFTTGYSYSTLHSDLSGYRINNPVGATPLTATDTRYANLGGGSDLNQYVMNLSLMNNPSKDWSIVPAVRVEKQDIKGVGSDNAIAGAPVQTVGAATTFSRGDKGALYVTESLDVRYTGITNWAFYGRMEFSEDQADLSERLTGVATPILRATEWDRLQQKYTVGANWYPTRKLNFAAQYYRKISDNDYNHTLDSSLNTGGGDRYPGYFGSQKFDVDDVNFRMTWRPLPLLTLVSRYDYQLSRVNTHPQGLAEIESGTNQRHMIGQSISWTPINRLYIQGSGNYVLDTTHSPVEDLTGAATGIVLSAPNKYWMASCIVGFALDNKTDLQTTYSYYRADNYVDNSAVGLPYGSGARQHEVGATLGRQLTRNLRWSLRYAFSKYQDQTSAGALDYEAHGIMSSLQYRF